MHRLIGIVIGNNRQLFYSAPASALQPCRCRWSFYILKVKFYTKLRRIFGFYKLLQIILNYNLKLQLKFSLNFELTLTSSLKFKFYNKNLSKFKLLKDVNFKKSLLKIIGTIIGIGIVIGILVAYRHRQSASAKICHRCITSYNSLEAYYYCVHCE